MIGRSMFNPIQNESIQNPRRSTMATVILYELHVVLRVVGYTITYKDGNFAPL